MLIKWTDSGDNDDRYYGKVGDATLHKYFVGPYGGKLMVADVRKDSVWMKLDLPFDTVEEAKKWCEAIETTGAY